MTTGEFADLVFKMRTAQKKYFRTRSQSAMTESKKLRERSGQDSGRTPEERNRKAESRPFLKEVTRC